jgi:hypothetical protein
MSMGGWLKDVRDSDKVGLMLLYTGLGVSVLGCGFTIFIVFHVKDENILDRVLVAIAGLSAQGAGLVTAAMGVLRFQSKADNPPTIDKVTTTVATSVAPPSPEAPK